MLPFFAICCVQSVEGMADGCFTSMSHSFATPEPKIMKGKLHSHISCHSYGTLLNKLALPSFRPMTVGLLTRKRMTSLEQKDMLLALCATNQMPICEMAYNPYAKFRNRLGHSEVSAHTAPAKHWEIARMNSGNVYERPGPRKTSSLSSAGLESPASAMAQNKSVEDLASGSLLCFCLTVKASHSINFFFHFYICILLQQG